MLRMQLQKLEKLILKAHLAQEVIPSVAAGNGRRRLIDVDVLVDYLSDPTKYCNERQK